MIAPDVLMKPRQIHREIERKQMRIETLRRFAKHLTSPLKEVTALPLGSSGCRQNLPRQIHCVGPRPQVRPHLAGRTARRERNPRTPPHIYRRDARPYNPDHQTLRRI